MRCTKAGHKTWWCHISVEQVSWFLWRDSLFVCVSVQERKYLVISVCLADRDLGNVCGTWFMWDNLRECWHFLSLAVSVQRCFYQEFSLFNRKENIKLGWGGKITTPMKINEVDILRRARTVSTESLLAVNIGLYIHSLYFLDELWFDEIMSQATCWFKCLSQ